MIKQVTNKVELIRHTPSPEATIAAAAKLCYSELPIDQIVDDINSSDNSKFIAMLIKLGHLSPLEHASFTFAIEGVSRAMLAQITRHRIASFSVRSQRYVAENEFGYVVPPSIIALGESAVDKYKSQMQTISQWYDEWQQVLGGNKEQSNEDARFVLPNAAETKLIVTMNARELLHFLELRCCERAQWEIRAVAWGMLDILIGIAPNIFKGAGPSCVRGACHEGKKSCGRMTEVVDKWRDIVKVATDRYVQDLDSRKNCGASCL